jgi:hypothetical protein
MSNTNADDANIHAVSPVSNGLAIANSRWYSNF